MTAINGYIIPYSRPVCKRGAHSRWSANSISHFHLPISSKSRHFLKSLPARRVFPCFRAIIARRKRQSTSSLSQARCARRCSSALVSSPAMYAASASAYAFPEFPAAAFLQARAPVKRFPAYIAARAINMAGMTYPGNPSGLMVRKLYQHSTKPSHTVNSDAPVRYFRILSCALPGIRTNNKPLIIPIDKLRSLNRYAPCAYLFSFSTLIWLFLSLLRFSGPIMTRNTPKPTSITPSAVIIDLTPYAPRR